MSEAGMVPATVTGGAAQEYAAFDHVYPSLQQAAYRVAFRLLGSREDAADVAQEACARAYARWHRVSRIESPPGWVAHVAANLAIDTWRRSRTARSYTPDPAPARRSDDERLDLHRALAALPRRQREIVILRYVADLPEGAVAAALGCSLGTVKSQASRGLAKLRAELGDNGEEG